MEKQPPESIQQPPESIELLQLMIITAMVVALATETKLYGVLQEFCSIR